MKCSLISLTPFVNIKNLIISVKLSIQALFVIFNLFSSRCYFCTTPPPKKKLFSFIKVRIACKYNIND